MKVISRDKKKEGDRQEAEKKRQLEKIAKVETLRKQAATTPVPADEEMEEHAVNTDGVGNGTTAGALRQEAEGVSAVGNAANLLRQEEVPAVGNAADLPRQMEAELEM